MNIFYYNNIIMGYIWLRGPEYHFKININDYYAAYFFDIGKNIEVELKELDSKIITKNTLGHIIGIKNIGRLRLNGTVFKYDTKNATPFLVTKFPIIK